MQRFYKIVKHLELYLVCPNKCLNLACLCEKIQYLLRTLLYCQKGSKSGALLNIILTVIVFLYTLGQATIITNGVKVEYINQTYKHMFYCTLGLDSHGQV